MYGAYQAGAWKVLSRHFQPDLVVGVSIGSLNAWVVASGAPPDVLERHWLEGEELATYRLRWPASLTHGVVDPANAYAVMQRMHRELQPQIPLAILARKGWTLRPVVFKDHDITWRHLAASCAIPGVFDLPNINGVTYADGGLIDPLPLFAARDLGASKILGINCMTWGGFGRVDAIQIKPAKRLGWTLADMLCWDRVRAERWIRLGEEDASRIVEAGAIQNA